MFWRISSGVVLSAVGLTMLTGCDPLTRNRFDMLVVNVSDQTEVRKTLGEPTYVHAEQWHFERPTNHLNVLVDFNTDGVVSRKQWIDAERNEWYDSAEPQEGMKSETTAVQTRH